MARRSFQKLRTKVYEKHSDTKIHTIGPGTVAVAFQKIRDTEQGPRDPAGAEDTIQLGRSNGEECNQGDICKYINVHIQAGPQLSAVANIGWIEWAVVLKKSSDANPTNVNLGTKTLGDVCTKYMRNECIMTGALPVGDRQASVTEIQLKIPKAKQMLKTGDEWMLFLYARTSSAVQTATDTYRVISSFNYKNYH